MLSQTLKWLEADSFVDRMSGPAVPPHVEYTPTLLGQAVAVRLGALADWLETSRPAIEQARAARATAAVRGMP